MLDSKGLAQAEKHDLAEIESYKQKIEDAREWVSDPAELERRVKFFQHQIELIQRGMDRRNEAYRLYFKCLNK